MDDKQTERLTIEQVAEMRYEAVRLLSAKLRLVDAAENAVGESVLALADDWLRVYGDYRTERVIFRLIRCPHCGHLVCWVNPRLPNYCPECGKNVMAKIKECILYTDEDALLKVKG